MLESSCRVKGSWRIGDSSCISRSEIAYCVNQTPLAKAGSRLSRTFERSRTPLRWKGVIDVPSWPTLSASEATPWTSCPEHQGCRCSAKPRQYYMNREQSWNMERQQPRKNWNAVRRRDDEILRRW